LREGKITYDDLTPEQLMHVNDENIKSTPILTPEVEKFIAVVMRS
jgi:hypothetical protein